MLALDAWMHACAPACCACLQPLLRGLFASMPQSTASQYVWLVVLLLGGCPGWSPCVLQADTQAAGDGQGAATGERGPQAALCMRRWGQEHWLWRRHAHSWRCAAVHLGKAALAIWLRADAGGERTEMRGAHLPWGHLLCSGDRQVQMDSACVAACIAAFCDSMLLQMFAG
jgi:hypothetical protein